MHPQPSRPSARAAPCRVRNRRPALHLSVAIGTQIEYHRPHDHATPIPQPRQPGAGPVAPSGGRPPRRPQPVIPASPQPALSLSKGDPAATNTPGPPPYPVNPRPPAHRLLASQPAHPTWSEPPPQPPRIGPNPNAPAPSRVFWKKLLCAHNTPASSSRTQQYSPIHHPGVFSRDPAATSKPGSPCHPVNPASPASPSRETRPAHRPSQRPSRRRRLANSPKKTASSYLWPAGPLWGPAGQR